MFMDGILGIHDFIFVQVGGTGKKLNGETWVMQICLVMDL